MFWGRRKPHPADLGLLFYLFNPCELVYPFPSHGWLLEAKGSGSATGNAGLCPRNGTVSLCSLQMPRALLEANYKR